MRSLIFATLILLLVACDTELPTNDVKTVTNSDSSTMKNNPFAKESTLPYSTPDFSKIENKHFMPAFTEGMKQQNKAIEKIITTTDPATFENTILPLETSNELLSRVGSVFFALSDAHTNDTIKEIQKELSPKLATQQDGIFLNKSLFDRID